MKAFLASCVLSVIFVALRLCGVIAWPWIWVLLPVWIGPAFVVMILLAICCGVAVMSFVEAWNEVFKPKASVCR